MTPAAWTSGMRHLLVAEQLFDLVPSLLQPAQRQGQGGHAVAHDVVGLVPAERHQQRPARSGAAARGAACRRAGLQGGGQAAGGQFGLQLGQAFLDLDREDLARLGEAGDRVGAQQPPAVDRDQVVADPLDLAEQVRGDHDGDAELRPDPADQLEHGGTAGRVEPVGRLVEQQQLRRADQGLGQLHPLLHAGGVGADQPVPLLVQADVPQRLRGAFLGHRGRQAGDPAQVGDELGRGHVARKAVVLGHVAEQRPDRLAAGSAVAAEHLGLALGRRDEGEQDLYQRGFARAVGADEPGDAGGDRDGETVERGDVARVHLGQRRRLDDGAGPGGAGLDGWHVCYRASTGPSGSSPARVKLPSAGRASAASAGPRALPSGVRLQDDALAGDRGYGSSVRTNSEVSAARQRPPLTKRLSPRHWAALDYVVGAVFGLILFATIRHGVVQAIESPYGFVPYPPLSLTWPLAMFLVLVAVVAVGMRRRRPAFMLGVLLAGSVVVTTLTGPENGALTYFLPVAYVLYLVAATYEHRQAAARVLIAVFATLLADAMLMHLTGGGFIPSGGLVSVALCVIIAWFTGYIVRQRRRYAIRLQDEAASKAVAEERLRIARELHDVVAHSMSVIAVQAGYGQYVIDTQPADARNALGAIQATSREALDEMRRMLGALRQADEEARAAGAAGAAVPGGAAAAADSEAGGSDGISGVKGISGVNGTAPLFPAPGLADLDRLISRTASAGVRVDVTRCGPPRELPASIDLSAYRIVQEALTNVVKHARTSSCQVLIGYGRDELILEVTDNGAGLPAMAGAGASHHGSSLALGGVPPGGPGLLAMSAAPGWDAPDADDGWAARGGVIGGSGHGIIGMRERVSLLGGEFSAGPLSGYGFQVSAHIPLPEGSPP